MTKTIARKYDIKELAVKFFVLFSSDYYTIKQLIATLMSINSLIWSFFNDVSKGVMYNKRVTIQDKAEYASDFMNQMFDTIGSIQSVLNDIDSKQYTSSLQNLKNQIASIYHDPMFQTECVFYLTKLSDDYDSKQINKELMVILLEAITKFDKYAVQYCTEIEPQNSYEARWKFIEKMVKQVSKKNKKTFLLEK